MIVSVCLMYVRLLVVRCSEKYVVYSYNGSYSRISEYLVAILDAILDNNVVPLLSQLQHAFS